MTIKSSAGLFVVREVEEDVLRQLRRPRARCAEQIEDINLPGACWNPWTEHALGDTFPTLVDPRYSRLIVILSSHSADPSITGTTDMDAHLLAAWDSPSPANFGGDGHHWWRAYYCVPTRVGFGLVDFDATGSAKYINWYSSDSELPSGLGTYGDGVDVTFKQDLYYGGSGVLINEAGPDTLSTVHGDMVQMFADFDYRTFDDLQFDTTFKQTGDFDRGQSEHNAIPLPIDYHLADTVDDGTSHTVTVGARVVVTPSVLTGSARGLATYFAAALHAHCMSEL